MEIKQIQQQFAKDVASHKMHIAHDNGLYKIITFKQDGESDYHFTITTHPYCLVITGDMGSFVFNRTGCEDVFKFFRSSQDTIGEVDISHYYWSEKVGAGAHSEFDKAGAVSEAMDLFISNDDKPLNFDFTRVDSIEEIKELLELAAEENEYVFFETLSEIAREFQINAYHEIYNGYEIHGGHSKPRYQYVWCCHAIAWAIAQYDAMKEDVECDWVTRKIRLPKGRPFFKLIPNKPHQA